MSSSSSEAEMDDPYLESEEFLPSEEEDEEDEEDSVVESEIEHGDSPVVEVKNATPDEIDEYFTESPPVPTITASVSKHKLPHPVLPTTKTEPKPKPKPKPKPRARAKPLATSTTSAVTPVPVVGDGIKKKSRQRRPSNGATTAVVAPVPVVGDGIKKKSRQRTASNGKKTIGIPERERFMKLFREMAVKRTRAIAAGRSAKSSEVSGLDPKVIDEIKLAIAAIVHYGHPDQLSSALPDPFKSAPRNYSWEDTSKITETDQFVTVFRFFCDVLPGAIGANAVEPMDITENELYM